MRLYLLSALPAPFRSKPGGNCLAIPIRFQIPNILSLPAGKIGERFVMHSLPPEQEANAGRAASTTLHSNMFPNWRKYKQRTMEESNFKEKIRTAALRRALHWFIDNPEKNGPKLISIIRKYGNMEGVETYLEPARTILDDPTHNWNIFLRGLLQDVDHDVLKSFMDNFVITAGLKGMKQKALLREQHKCNIPWTILFDPTSACNLHCTGCWAAEYGHKLNLSMETWESIIEQGKELGTYMFIYSGGEPLVRRKDIITMCRRHPECIFLAFTNGTLIDEEFAEEMLRVRNFIPAISVEGFETETDSRRGDGCYEAVVRAMKILKDKKLPFGISCCYTRTNTHIIGSERYFDDMIERGAKFAWFFTYIPVGKDAVRELMVTPEQREFMFHQIRRFRSEKPIFTLDFWNDGEFVNGCIAGGRCYLHINANGDIEPCAFIHYSDSNIRDTSILEACKSPLFMQYYHGQPFNENMLRPCPLLDNPHRLADMVQRSGAKSTDMQSPENVLDLTEKCTYTARQWGYTADKLWYADHETGCAGCRKQAWLGKLSPKNPRTRQEEQI